MKEVNILQRTTNKCVDALGTYKGKEYTIPHEERWWDAHIPYLGTEPVGG